MPPVKKHPPLDNELVKAVKAGQCILFLGAGVHYPPDDNDPDYGGSYPLPERPPVGSNLATILAGDSPLATDTDYTTQEKRPSPVTFSESPFITKSKKGDRRS